MAAKSSMSPDERLRVALELFESGVAMMREKLRREFPSETEVQIEARLRRWLRHRPGAEHGDCVGRRIDLSSRRR